MKKGNSESVTLLYEAFYKGVYYICYSMVKDEETAKDLTSDTFVTAFSKIMQLNREETFRAWLSSIANHTYSIDVANPDDSLLVLTFVLAMDAEKCSRND